MRRTVLLLGLLLALSACQAQPAGPAPKVQTDWSKLEAREPFTPIGSRWYENYTDRLIPRDDYGMLIPYAGARLSDGTGDEWYVLDGCQYGLMTKDGTVVTDPVFPSIYRPGWYSGKPGQTIYHTHPLLVLSRGNEAGEKRYAVAAADGSRCTDFTYRRPISGKDGLLLFSDDGAVLMAPDGSIAGAYSWAELGFTEENVPSFLDNIEWDEGTLGWYGDHIELGTDDNGNIRLCFRRSTGQPEKHSLHDWELLQIPQQGDGYELYLRREETTVIRDGVTYHIPVAASDGASLEGDVVLFWNGGGVYALDGTEILPPLEGSSTEYVMDSLLGEDAPGLIRRYDRQTNRQCYYRTDGTPLPFLDGYATYGPRQAGLAGGLIEVLDTDTASYYDLDTLECVLCVGLTW